MYVINPSNKKVFGWGDKIATPGPSNLSNCMVTDHSVVGLFKKSLGVIPQKLDNEGST